MVTGVIPSPPRFLPSIFIAHRVQQSHCSSIFHRTLLTHALALSASQFVHKKKSSMHSAGLELTKLTHILYLGNPSTAIFKAVRSPARSGHFSTYQCESEKQDASRVTAVYLVQLLEFESGNFASFDTPTFSQRPTLKPHQKSGSMFPSLH